MPNRQIEVDGIRGWAALSVLFCHLFVDTFGDIFPGFRNMFTHLFFNGALAVAIFFVLSGDALSMSYLKFRSSRSLDSIVVKRYFRLTVPILMSCSLVYCLMVTGLNFNVQAADVVHREAWLGKPLNFAPSFVGMLHYALSQVYEGNTLAVSYNPFLWTMAVEMIGSMVVLLYLHIAGRLKYPQLTLTVLIVFLFIVRSYNFYFLCGLLFGKWRANGTLAQIQNSKKWRFGKLLIFTTSILIIANTKGMAMVTWLAPPMLVFVFYTTDATIKFFTSRLSRFLGKISFSLYLVHFAVLSSLTSFLIIRYQSENRLDLSNIAVILCVSVVACIVVAVIFEKLEAAAMKIVNRIPAKLFTA